MSILSKFSIEERLVISFKTPFIHIRIHKSYYRCLSVIKPLTSTLLFLATIAIAHTNNSSISEQTIQETFKPQQGAFVVIDCSSHTLHDFTPETSSELLPPCSTFKIWNTLIGLENGILHSPQEAFYQWDGQIRSIPDWNKNLTLREAFQVSCVPAFQNLARKIGTKRMQETINKIGYGNRDLSAGIDVFWLPAPGRKTLLISPKAQVQLLDKLLSNELPISSHSTQVLKDIMFIKKTDRGTLYGKTGSMTDDNNKYILGWFVGFVENDNKTCAFATMLKGEGVIGKNAQSLAETMLKEQGLL